MLGFLSLSSDDGVTLDAMQNFDIPSSSYVPILNYVLLEVSHVCERLRRH